MFVLNLFIREPEEKKQDKQRELPHAVPHPTVTAMVPGQGPNLGVRNSTQASNVGDRDPITSVITAASQSPCQQETGVGSKTGTQTQTLLYEAGILTDILINRPSALPKPRFLPNKSSIPVQENVHHFHIYSKKKKVVSSLTTS